MHIEIMDEPIHFRLHGIEGTVENERYSEVGLRLMDAMWQIVKGNQIPNTGINHWVYLPSGKMFVGVELRTAPDIPIPAPLASVEFTLPRYLKHLHVGSYQALPKKWKDLKAEITKRGETVGGPSLEIYGHHDPDASKLETTILIGLR